MQIYSNVYQIAKPIFAEIIRAADDPARSAEARPIARDFRTMLLNMTAHPTNPIHPIGFFSVVKDFETAG